MTDVPDDIKLAAIGAAMGPEHGLCERIERAILAERSAAKRRIEELEAGLQAEQAMTALLRADLMKFAEGGAVYQYCEGCKAPIGDDEEFSTAEVHGCWGYVSDWKGAPCYRYRTVEGVDRSWPECAALLRAKEGEDA